MRPPRPSREVVGLRLLALGSFVALSATASANAAMGLALEMFEFRTWIVYACVMVLLEAWLIGTKLGFAWLNSILLSLLFNLITAFTCVIGCFAPFLHGTFIGSQLNPNPFFDAVFLLALFGVISGGVEGFFWGTALRLRREAKPVLLRSIGAHLIGVPVALVILLIPARPYRGLEASTGFQRSFFVRLAVRGAYRERSSKPGPFRQFGTFDELMAAVPPDRAHTDDWAARYEPDYHRFDTGEMKRRRIRAELNPGFPKAGNWAIKIWFKQDEPPWVYPYASEEASDLRKE